MSPTDYCAVYHQGVVYNVSTHKAGGFIGWGEQGVFQRKIQNGERERGSKMERGRDNERKAEKYK